VPKTEIRVEAADTFFKRGRKFARLADRKERISDTRVVAFEDSISALARMLKQDRSAVTRNI